MLTKLASDRTPCPPDDLGVPLQSLDILDASVSIRLTSVSLGSQSQLLHLLPGGYATSINSRFLELVLELVATDQYLPDPLRI